MSAVLRPLMLTKTTTKVNVGHIDLISFPWQLAIESIGVAFRANTDLPRNRLIKLCINLCESTSIESFPGLTEFTPLCQFKLEYSDGFFFYRADTHFFPVTAKRQDVTYYLFDHEGNDITKEIHGSVQILCNFRRQTFKWDARKN